MSMLRLISCYENQGHLKDPAKRARINFFKHHADEETWLINAWQGFDFIKEYFKKFYILLQAPNKEFKPEAWEDLQDRYKLEVIVLDGN